MVLNKPKSINHMNHVFDVVLFIIYLLLQDEQKILIYCVAYLRTVVRILYLTCRLPFLIYKYTKKLKSSFSR